jgi:hypothetical protein
MGRPSFIALLQRCQSSSVFDLNCSAMLAGLKDPGPPPDLLRIARVPQNLRPSPEARRARKCSRAISKRGATCGRMRAARAPRPSRKNPAFALTLVLQAFIQIEPDTGPGDRAPHRPAPTRRDHHVLRCPIAKLDWTFWWMCSAWSIENKRLARNRSRSRVKRNLCRINESKYEGPQMNSVVCDDCERVHHPAQDCEPFSGFF